VKIHIYTIKQTFCNYSTPLDPSISAYDDLHQKPITELEVDLVLSVDLAEVNVEKAKAKTTTLAREAKNSILELRKLLEKISTGTATLEEKDYLVEVNKQLWIDATNAHLKEHKWG